MTVSFVVRNAEGQALLESYSSYKKGWQKLWNNYYATLNVSNLPTTVGSYTLELYFNGNYVASNSFSIAK